MSVFDHYARYYDLLYRDKDYAAEADFVADLIRTHAPRAHTLLELGCGTGRHAELLARQAFATHGVDLSEGMLADAERRRGNLSDELRERLAFSRGDVRGLRLGRQFDAVISLFHVMSYMTKPQDLERAFATARAHLAPGGIFLFDFWYGPAVLCDPPMVRVKRMFDDQLEVIRIAEPTLYPNENCVDVNYEVHIREKGTEMVNCLRERHRMRYLFLPEIRELLGRNGMEPLSFREWLTGKEPDCSTWNVTAVGRVVPS
jgi:SAM-dependent methyltransferase